MSEEIKTPDLDNIDPDTAEGAAIVDALVAQRLAALETEEQKPKIQAQERAEKPKVKGEAVPTWQQRSFRKLHGIIKSQSRDQSDIISGSRALIEFERQERAMVDWQKDEEQKHVDNVIAGSGLSRMVQSRLHSMLSGPSGEFSMPKAFLAELFVFIEEYGLARRLARIVPMTTLDLELNSVATKPVATWTGEAERYTESDFTQSQKKMATKKLGAVTSITHEGQENSWVALISTWLQLLAESIAQKEDEAWIRGDGTSTYGGFTGLANLGSAQVNTLGAGDLNFSDVVESDFRTTRNALSTVRQRGARWIMHRNLWDRVEQFESTGGYRIVQTMLTQDGQQVMNLLGYPVELSEAMVNAATDVASVDFAIFGNYSRTLMGIRNGITVESSRDAVLHDANDNVVANAFQDDMTLVKIGTRIGFGTPAAMEDGFAVMNAPAS